VAVEGESLGAGAVPLENIVELDGGRAVLAHVYDGQVAYTAAIRVVVVRVDQKADNHRHGVSIPYHVERVVPESCIGPRGGWS
jgi:hypothetical protein